MSDIPRALFCFHKGKKERAAGGDILRHALLFAEKGGYFSATGEKRKRVVCR